MCDKVSPLIVLPKGFVPTSFCCMELAAGPGGRATYGVGLRPLACWDCGFESHRGHGCLSVVSVVCCQVEFSASG